MSIRRKQISLFALNSGRAHVDALIECCAESPTAEVREELRAQISIMRGVIEACQTEADFYRVVDLLERGDEDSLREFVNVVDQLGDYSGSAIALLVSEMRRVGEWHLWPLVALTIRRVATLKILAASPRIPVVGPAIAGLCVRSLTASIQAHAL